MRAVLTLLALIGSLLLFLCLARLPADGAGGASGWDMEGRAATDYTPRVMRYLRSPTNVRLVTPVAPDRTILNTARVQKSEQASKCKDIWSNNWSSSIKKKRYSEDYYLQIVGNLQNCTWNRRPQEYAKFRITIAHKPTATICQELSRTKDMIQKDERNNVIYKNNYNNCSQFYVVQTSIENKDP